jgi:CRISPR-associated protein Csd2
MNLKIRRYKMNIPDKIKDVKVRHDFMFMFDCTDGNPNGSPDADNMPRVDPETMHGLVTDGSIKRKVRDVVDIMHGTEETYKIYIQNRGIALNTLHERAYTEKGLKSTGTKQNREDVDNARLWMCENFFDVRMFGAVMTTAFNCGQVCGPVQIAISRSVDPIVPVEIPITRVAVTRKEDTEIIASEEGSDKKSSGKQNEMGRKFIIPYGLYVGHGHFSTTFAERTGVSEKDMEIFWDAFTRIFDMSHSASRGEMNLRQIYVFSHESKWGNAPSHKLTDLISVKRKPELEIARKFSDYEITVDDNRIPERVSLTCIL